jgi:cytochrome c oxidase subunit 2
MPLLAVRIRPVVLVFFLAVFLSGVLGQADDKAPEPDSTTPTIKSLSEGRNTLILEPESPPARTIAEVFYLILGIVAVIFLLVFVPLVWMLFRFRMRKEDEGIEPPQIYGSNPIEVAWTVGPAIIVFVLFLVTARSIFEIEAAVPPADAVHVRVIGHQWWWEYEYPEYGFITANELHAPLAKDGTPRPVFLDLESADVIHSFWLPQLSGKTDVIPGRVNHLWFAAEKPGWYKGQCAEYCGTQHAHMWLRVKAETDQEFAMWADNEQKDAVMDPSTIEGRTLFMENACANCHTVRGTTAVGRFAPDLTHLMSRKTIASGIVPNTREYLLQWVRDPQTLKQGCNMPDMKLTNREVEKIVDYLLTLK